MEFRDRAPVRNTAAALLRDLIQERAGIWFPDHNMELLLDKISSLLAERGSDSLVDYYYHLKYDGDDRDWISLLNAITTRETFFWREFDQIQALVDVVIPNLAAAGHQPIKIWSAACASGEEPLTIAMALELAGWFDRIPIEIHASDASEAALGAARAGIYRERSFRDFPMKYRSRFFVPAEDKWRVKFDLHQRVQWHRLNLTDTSAVERIAQVPVIFCRNVFIYFSEATVFRTAKVFERSMCRPGYLFLGAAESLLKFAIDLRLEEINRTFVYVKC